MMTLGNVILRPGEGSYCRQGRPRRDRRYASNVMKPMLTLHISAFVSNALEWYVS